MLKRFFAFIAALLVATPAFADYPKSWELNLQQPAGPLAQQMVDFHHLLIWIITAIVIFVMGLLLWVIVRYNAKANPVPSTTTHNTMIEVVWTIIPVIIL